MTLLVLPSMPPDQQVAAGKALALVRWHRTVITSVSLVLGLSVLLQ